MRVLLDTVLIDDLLNFAGQDKAFLTQLLQQFKVYSARDLESLQAHAERPEVHQRIIHNFRGRAANLGMIHLATVAKKMGDGGDALNLDHLQSVWRLSIEAWASYCDLSP